VIVARRFEFQASHLLPRHPGKCRNLHGHTYFLEVWCEGPVDPATGMVVDFGEVKAEVADRVLSRLDHSHLNDLLENPTAEEVARWILARLREGPLPVAEVRLWETPSCFVVCREP
jgi:6-pyruvoyltetrahydropterin/6-carboxytetrahydropterin synthase